MQKPLFDRPLLDGGLLRKCFRQVPRLGNGGDTSKASLAYHVPAQERSRLPDNLLEGKIQFVLATTEYLFTLDTLIGVNYHR